MAHGWHSSCILKMPNDSKWPVSDIDSIDPILIDTVHGIKTHQSISKPHVSRDFNKSDPSPFAICHGALHATARASSPCLALVGFALRLHVDSLICFMRFTSQDPNITFLRLQFQGATSLSPYFCWWRLATKSNFAWFLFLRNLVEGWRFVSFRDVAALNATKFEESTEPSSRVFWCLPQTGDKFRSNMNRGSFLPFVGRKWFGPMWTTISFCTFQMYLWWHFAVHLLDIRKLLDIETLEIGSKTLRLQRGLALELSTSHHEFTFHGLRTKSFFSKASMHSIWAREWVHEWLDKRFLDRKASKCESNVSHDGSFTDAKFDPLDDFGLRWLSLTILNAVSEVLLVCPCIVSRGGRTSADLCLAATQWLARRHSEQCLFVACRSLAATCVCLFKYIVSIHLRFSWMSTLLVTLEFIGISLWNLNHIRSFQIPCHTNIFSCTMGPQWWLWVFLGASESRKSVHDSMKKLFRVE